MKCYRPNRRRVRQSGVHSRMGYDLAGRLSGITHGKARSPLSTWAGSCVVPASTGHRQHAGCLLLDLRSRQSSHRVLVLVRCVQKKHVKPKPLNKKRVQDSIMSLRQYSAHHFAEHRGCGQPGDGCRAHCAGREQCSYSEFSGQ